jgi:hypothetical protein
MTATEIEIAVALHFGYLENIIVPNVSYGMHFQHELDLLVVRPTGYAIEVEIKVDPSDIKADALKRHHHAGRVADQLLKALWFAVPERLENHPDIPKHAGILSVYKYERDVRLHVKVIRSARNNPKARRLNDKELRNLGRLAAMRIWTLKTKLMRERKHAKASHQ